MGQPHIGGNCQTVYPDAVEEWTAAGFSSCAIRGQQLAAQWVSEHPKYEVDRVRCTIGSDPRPGRNDI
jgi:hypothetical protein